MVCFQIRHNLKSSILAIHAAIVTLNCTRRRTSLLVSQRSSATSFEVNRWTLTDSYTRISEKSSHFFYWVYSALFHINYTYRQKNRLVWAINEEEWERTTQKTLLSTLYWSDFAYRFHSSNSVEIFKYFTHWLVSKDEESNWEYFSTFSALNAPANHNYSFPIFSNIPTHLLFFFFSTRWQTACGKRCVVRSH